jgi:ATP/maltotriose-dependent transcriptional regulator MalT/DNA-binding SARP family transcriptional activator
MSEYPVQLEKVQVPPLRDDILARDRLLDWLNVKIHSRVVLLTAEAGYGKTTLLADFARRTRLRVLWFRLDRGDRDWVGFLAHLVAAVRVHQPDFGPMTAALLRETGSSAPPLGSVLDTFLRELGDLPPEPAAFVFDDFHLVDDSEEVRLIAREMLTRAPERLSFILASRRTPPVRLARLRGLGEVAELGAAELRFDIGETGQLFAETYSMELDQSIVMELSRRTEGWVTSLRLARAALQDRDPSQRRAFVHSISGSEGHLYDFLAEEVIGDLDEPLQRFLMHTAVLDTIDSVLGPVAAGLTSEATEACITAAEAHGLLGRQGLARGQVRAHPLVRDFLRARLVRSVGEATVRQIHHRVAEAAEGFDWRTATAHYLDAGEQHEAERVLSAALETILATGAYASAETLVAALPNATASFLRAIVLSRVALKAGDSEAAQRHASAALALEPSSDVAIWNSLMVNLSCGSLDGLRSYAAQLREVPSTRFRQISAEAAVAMIESSVDGPLDLAVDVQIRAGDEAARSGQRHFFGVSRVNAAQMRRVRGDAVGVLELADVAIQALEATSSGIELVSARLVRAWALAHLGEMVEARAELGRAESHAVRRLEFAFEAADIEALYGSVERAEEYLAPFRDHLDPQSDVGEQALLTQISIDIARGRLHDASSRLATLAWARQSTGPGVEVRRRVARATVLMIESSPLAAQALEEASQLARRQGAGLWLDYISALGGLPDESRRDRLEGAALSMAAEVFVQHFPLPARLAAAVQTEARRRPDRWRPALRRAVENGPTANAVAAGQLLDEIGEVEDIRRLRALARRFRSVRPLDTGRMLARRLARPVVVADLGHVQIRVGARLIEGTAIRRKVLALLCYLVTRQVFRAQREEVIEALWPDLEPSSALNSLNQTVYFLRRAFEPEYSDETTPGYVGQTAEFVWLDAELVNAESVRCRDLIRAALRSGGPDDALAAVRAYTGQFALDFIYEDWSGPYRERLHASYLQLIESSVTKDLRSGQFLRGIEFAQAASEIEPASETIQLALLKLYRLSGAHAAAAEQYGRYAALLSDLGLDVPPMEAV